MKNNDRIKGIQSKKNRILPEIILGYLIKLYKFNKYRNEKIFYPKNLHLFKISKKIINDINYNLNLIHAINLTKDFWKHVYNKINSRGLHGHKYINVSLSEIL